MGAPISCGFVILSGFLTLATGLLFMLRYLGRPAEVTALWAIVAALGVLQIGIGAIGSLLSALVERKLPPKLPGSRFNPPQRDINDTLRDLNNPTGEIVDIPLAADADLFDSPADEKED